MYVLERQLYSLGLEERALRLGTQVKRMVQLSRCATVHRSLAGAQTKFQKVRKRDFPGGPVVKNLPCNVGDAGLSPRWFNAHMPRGN